jgi:NMD protein affecting ribosome stability and mRNA decay
MEMLIESLGNDILRLTHSYLRTEPITPAVLVTPATDEVDALRCSVCNRMEIEGAWLEPEMASKRESRDQFHVSYTVCPFCYHGLTI